MKHLKESTEKEVLLRSGNAFLMLLRAALFALIFGFADGSLAAQCTLDCLGNDPTQPLSIIIDEDCEVGLDTSLLLASASTCPGDKLITVRDSLSNLIASDNNSVSFDAAPYNGQLLRVTIEDLQSGFFCNSFVSLMDTFPPAIMCLSDTINCLADTSVAELGYPIITDNCSGDVTVNYVDTMMAFPCQGPDVALIERTWTASDIFGNTAVCVQSIHLRRPQLTDVSFPPDTTMACDGYLPDPDHAGWPTLFGDTIGLSNECFLSVFFEDDTIPSCSAQTFELLRTWTVTESCTGEEVTEIQLISVVDTVAPQITCPPDTTVNTSPASCYGQITLTAPAMTDNCDGDATFFVNTSYGAVGLGPHNFVPVGTHTLQYTAIDACQNTRTCTTILNVVDAGPPTAVCDDAVIVALPSGGYGTASALTFEEESVDNCASTLYFKVRRVNEGECGMSNGDDSGLPGYQEWFDDQVRFCCEDIGEDIQVLLRVYEIDPGAGPVDPSREIPPGDLYGHYSECLSHVEVQDRLAPQITCPHDTAVDCSADYSDLTAFGNPMVSDNCGAQVTLEEETSLDECGTGTITRTFRAFDPSGNISSCTQEITVTRDPFTESNIIWPQNYSVDICGASTEPDDLPDGYGRPEVVGMSCANIGIIYEDDFFNIAMPACYKILRRWTVIDWCEYDPEYPDAGGRFSKVQVVKVEDNDPPVLDCPAAITRGVSSDCSSASITLPPVMAVDCNPNLVITNDSPFANSGGPNASGNYPLGTTVVTFSAADRCGNYSECQVDINVVDNQAPAVICIVGLSINLSGSNGDGYATLQAAAFDGGSTDNCTSSPDLRRTIRRAGTGIPGTPPATTELSFTCADRGNQPIEFWVTDAVGNSDYCVTVIAIQDNNGICPQQASGMISGDIQTEMGEYVENVTVKTSGSSNIEGFTGNFGFFEILDVPYGGDYTVTARREDDPLNGVSTLDLVLISKHILGVQLLGSPYKQIAADVNRSGTISTLDMISLRKMILGQDANFPNGNTSWRFIDAGYLFPDPQDPFASPFPEIININNFSQSEMEADFVAIKVGDVDNSAVPGSLLGVESRAVAGRLPVRLPDLRAKAGELISVPFTARQLNGILGYQFSLGFKTEYLEWAGLEPGNLPGMTEEHFNLQMAGEGRISTSWNWPAATASAGDEDVLLFSLVFRARRDIGTLRPLIFAGNDPTRAEAYALDGGLLDVRLQFEAAPQEEAPEEKLELYQNRPNPFNAETAIGFRLPKSGAARLSVISLSGQLIYRKEGFFERGYHEFTISAADLPASGVLYYQLQTDGQAVTRKMILM
ncbi:MAG: HYR domain-containing protein [Lewinellaceae bacterium]|nr:HYR domain-containing protein [Lewinellaceae bacterium]